MLHEPQGQVSQRCPVLGTVCLMRARTVLAVSTARKPLRRAEGEVAPELPPRGRSDSTEMHFCCLDVLEQDISLAFRSM